MSSLFGIVPDNPPKGSDGLDFDFNQHHVDGTQRNFHHDFILIKNGRIIQVTLPAVLQ